jgi:hypothetical protein
MAGLSDDVYTIHGLSDSGKRLTLLRAREIRRNQTFPTGFASVMLHAEAAIVGHHLPPADDVLLESVSIRLTDLDDWLQDSGIVQTMIAEKGKPPHKVTAAFEYPEEYDVHVHDFTASFRVTFVWNPVQSGQLQWRVERALQVTPDEPMELLRLMAGPVRHVRNLIAFAIGAPVLPVTITGVIPRSLRDPNSDGSVRIYSRGVKALSASSKRRRDYLLPFSELKDTWSTMLSAWINGANRLTPLFDAYFAALYAGEMYEENRFLMFTRAAEVYHRREHPGTYLSGARFEVLREALSAVLGDTLSQNERVHAKALLGKLAFMNEYSLRRRLKDLLADLGTLVDLVITRRSQFVGKVVEIRNHLTHYDEGSSAARPDMRELHNLTEQLKFVLEILLLLQLGIDRQRAAEVISKHEPYRQLGRQQWKPQTRE